MSGRKVLPLLAVLVVLTTYAFFGSLGHFTFPLVTWRQSYYASLTEGFLNGKLSMAHEPPAGLASLNNPYRIEERQAAGIRVIYDASYYEGRYYLYFSPVPAVLFFVPFKLLFGGYPSETLATTVFASIGFLFIALFLRRAMWLSPRAPVVPLWVWILALGIGNLIPYVLIRSGVYQVAIGCAMMFTGAWAYSLVRFIETRNAGRVAVMSLCLALALASRPNLMVLGLPTVIALLVFRPRDGWARSAFALVLPILLVGGAIMAYNQARFGDPFQSGHDYQLTANPHSMCSLTHLREVARVANGVLHYVFWAPSVDGEFPFVTAPMHRLDPETSYRGWPEPIVGVAFLSPLILIGSFLALLLPRRNPWSDPRLAPGLLVLVSGWIVLVSLSSCAWVTARYVLDFVWLLLAGAILCTEVALSRLADMDLDLRPLRALCGLVIVWSIVFALLLALSRGLGDREAPTAAERHAAMLGGSP